MCKCSNCKFSELLWDMNGYQCIWCKADANIIEIETAENDEIGCGYYIDDMDDDN